ncbi:hypothetical protein BpHYR1_011077 [Brachionus plicatilis]|uniref:Uncharacterized protein n=1 Tax=Brachionus plicatilis TaxID=10195 RepID=A0A3M7RYJ5_BRAPC|nr:hypothetical protein BpHYR1_011077 [Brachionus plicatilis]
MKFYKEKKAKITEFIKKLHIKGKKAFEIRKKALEIFPENLVPKLGAIRARIYRLKKKLNFCQNDYFNQIECSDAYHLFATIAKFLTSGV